jgi:curli production assembly/transport component CsgG
MALFSTAVTQGAEMFLIGALQNAGRGTWFSVVERAGLDHITRERQLIKSTRTTYEGEGASILKPLLFAGLILEGGIISYSSNEETGGIGARFLGLGAQNRYRRDRVTVSLRMVLVQTGEILLSVQTSKTIFSAASGLDVFRFIELGTELIEIERGKTRNENADYAVRSAIETAVYSLIMDGIHNDLWDFETHEEAETEVK